MSNMGLEKYLTDKLKLKIKRTACWRYQCNKQMKKSNSLIGGEQSGHIIMSNIQILVMAFCSTKNYEIIT